MIGSVTPIRALTQEEYERLRSPYIAGGFKQGDLRVRDVEVGDGCISARCDAVDCFMAGDGMFHLTIQQALLVVSDLAVVGGHVWAGLDRKRDEVYMTRFAIHCRRPIRTPEGIDARLTTARATRTGHGLIYRGTFAIDDGAFTGSGTFLLPLGSAAG